MPDESLAFVDTNIFVYAFSSGNDPRQLAARQLHERLLHEDRLCLSTQVLQELFVSLTRKYSQSPDVVLPLLHDLTQWPCFSIDPAAVEDAGRLSVSAQLSFWDSLIVVAARRMGAETLYSEDMNNGQMIEGVKIVNPF